MPDKLEVWIGLANVVPRPECEVLDESVGAFVNVLALARNAAEFRRKILGACNDYGFDLVELEDCEPFDHWHARYNPAEEIVEAAEALTDPGHVRYTTFHTYPRII